MTTSKLSGLPNSGGSSETVPVRGYASPAQAPTGTVLYMTGRRDASGISHHSGPLGADTRAEELAERVGASPTRSHPLGARNEDALFPPLPAESILLPFGPAFERGDFSQSMFDVRALSFGILFLVLVCASVIGTGFFVLLFGL
jgi:hypothetical protein